jgi:UDPglucose 6-dehydrogenase
MHICVIGSGYVGLVTGAVFADLGNDVICVDSDQKRIDTLLAGECPIYEPRLPELLHRNRREGRLQFTTCTRDGVEPSEIVFICVGTPSKETGQTDLSQVEAAATEIAGCLNGYKIIVNKSTVPVGTGDIVRRVIETQRQPEFLREGQAVRDTLQPDRIVIGTSSEKAATRISELYRTLDCPILVTDICSAEIIKYASNAFLATKISFINAVANICEESGADVKAVAKGMGTDQRIGPHFLEAGLGYGGSCFPKDIDSLIHTSMEMGAPFNILQKVSRENETRIPRLASRIMKRVGHESDPSLDGKTIGIFGLSFKPDTDDMREAKSVELCRLLIEAKAQLRVYDPVAMEKAKAVIGEDRVTYCTSAYDAAKDADAAVFVTEWREFRQLDLRRLRESLRQPILFDGRNIYTPKDVSSAGIEYHSIGRPVAFPGDPS